MMPRRTCKPINIGDVIVGGDSPVVVQSMTKTDTRNIASTINQIRGLEEIGCELIRVAVPDMEAAQALASIKKGIHIPLIADIHFDYRLALASLQSGINGLRLNPGNIRNPEHVAAIVKAAREREVPIRVGANAGSLPPFPEPAPNSPPQVSVSTLAQCMVDAALEQVRLLESLDFDLIKVSLKAFDVPTTIEAYRIVADKIPYPLHLGITEAGLPGKGTIRSALGIGILLYQGIGDTIRVSLTGEPKEEVLAAYEILKSLNLREHGLTLVSCPTCGRCEVDLISLAGAVLEYLTGINKPIKVAVMGCVVNGPGEARDADIGIACGKGRGTIFRKGEVVRTVEEKDFLNALIAEVESLI